VAEKDDYAGLPVCPKHGPHSPLGCGQCSMETYQAKINEFDIPDYSSKKKWAESQLIGYVPDEEIEAEAHRLVKEFNRQNKDIRDFVLHEVMVQDRTTFKIECKHVWRLRI
jgi:hypothetical protein